ncbi:hypothetical protein BSKO_11173 [Bryopsis sp. KO-2023]|nr:hypothetical protein BSKO_11173 [Bryopsis sp. KO-2023]
MRCLQIATSSKAAQDAHNAPPNVPRYVKKNPPKSNARHQPLDPSLKRRALLSGVLASGLAFSVDASYAGKTPFDLGSCQSFQKAEGLEVCEVRKGNGDAAEPGDLIEVNYTARALSTGKVYDGSKGFRFFVGEGEIIKGWDEAILGNSELEPMKEGGQRTVIIPASKAYGKAGSGCSFGLDKTCTVPPDSPVEITFQYVSLIG